MRCWLGLLTLGFALLGCSGKYVVGTMDDPNGAGGSYPTAGQGVGAYGPGGYSNQGDAGAFAVAGTTSYAGGAAYAGGSAGGSMPTGGAPDGARFGVAEYCVGPSTSLFQFDEPIASRDVIWQRMSRLLHGKVVAPPPDWSEMVSAPQMLVIINRELESLNNGQAPGSEGAGLFLIDWLELEGPMATDQIYYQALMSSNTDLMFLLLQQEHFGSLSVGVFTEPEWLVQNKTISSRGAKMMNQLFGTSVPLPPPGSIMNGTPDPNLPDRQALDKQIEQPVCRSCHVLVDPPGYALDIFDSAGQWRTTDHGQPIDTSGQLRLMLEQRDLPFADLKDLMTKASQTCDANVAVADAFLRFAMRINGFDEASIEGVPPADKALVENRFLYGGRSYGSCSALTWRPAWGTLREIPSGRRCRAAQHVCCVRHRARERDAARLGIDLSRAFGERFEVGEKVVGTGQSEWRGGYGRPLARGLSGGSAPPRNLSFRGGADHLALWHHRAGRERAPKERALA